MHSGSYVNTGFQFVLHLANCCDGLGFGGQRAHFPRIEISLMKGGQGHILWWLATKWWLVVVTQCWFLQWMATQPVTTFGNTSNCYFTFYYHAIARTLVSKLGMGQYGAGGQGKNESTIFHHFSLIMFNIIWNKEVTTTLASLTLCHSKMTRRRVFKKRENLSAKNGHQHPEL